MKKETPDEEKTTTTTRENTRMDIGQLETKSKDELMELASVVERVQEGWRRSRRSEDDFYLDSVALNLHGFYAGMERLFELIAVTIDGSIPQGANWHQLLV